MVCLQLYCTLHVSTIRATDSTRSERSDTGMESSFELSLGGQCRSAEVPGLGWITAPPATCFLSSSNPTVQPQRRTQCCAMLCDQHRSTTYVWHPRDDAGYCRSIIACSVTESCVRGSVAICGHNGLLPTPLHKPYHGSGAIYGPLVRRQ